MNILSKHNMRSLHALVIDTCSRLELLPAFGLQRGRQAAHLQEPWRADGVHRGRGQAVQEEEGQLIKKECCDDYGIYFCLQ